jgi:quinolinate synthase
MYHGVDFTSTYAYMQEKLGQLLQPAEIYLKAELVCAISALKREKNAIILGHNYMEPALYHTVADFRGDSLALARKSAETTADTIVFCGVEFMAETAKILNPRKKVLLPSLKAGCSLAASITAEDVRALKAAYPGAPVVTYVNSSAAVKAESDICCTSGNAKAVVESLDAKMILFLPDEYLARNVAKETGKHLILAGDTRSAGAQPGQQGMVAWHGRCEVHEKFSVEDIREVRAQFPEVVVLAHPECAPEVCAAADFSGSTAAMISYVQRVEAKHYLLLTECAMGDNIIAENPDKELLRMCSIRCPHMAQITLEMTLAALEQDRYQIEVPEEIRVKAERAITRMLAIG